MDIAQYLEIRQVAAGSTALFAAAGLLILAARIFWPAGNSVSTKLLGSILVLALAFAANNEFVYALAIFIVATLVTDLDFLEKIAALFWNRDKYWDYRIANASPAELAEKAKADAAQELAAERLEQPEAASLPAEAGDASPAEPGAGTPPEPSPRERAAVQPEEGATTARMSSDEARRMEPGEKRAALARQFESAVLGAIAGGKLPIPPGDLKVAQRLVTPAGPKILDAVLETPAADFVFEVKYIMRPSLLIDAASKVLQLSRDYHAFLRLRSKRKLVIPVLVVPSNINAPTRMPGVLVARFDEERKELTNLGRFRAEVERALAAVI